MKLSEVCWIVCFNLLFFASFIQNQTGFAYLDEMIAVLFCISAVMKSLSPPNFERDRLMPKEKTALFLLMAMACIGVLGNLTQGVQQGIVPIAIDLFTCMKFVIMLLSAIIVFNDVSHIIELVEKEAKVLVSIMLICALVNLLFDIGMGVDPRFGLRASFKFVFGHPTYLCMAGVGLTLVLMKNPEKNKRWIYAALLVVALSLRSKGIVFSAIALFLLLTMHKGKRLSVFHFLFGIVIAVLLGWDQFAGYYQPGGFARNELTLKAAAIANDTFPFGAGFATYGSAVTAGFEYYSPLYYQYGLSTVQGLSPGHASFLSDTFWPTVLGQFGWLGMACFIGCIILLAWGVYFQRKGGLAALCCFLYLLISSTAESAFFNPQAVYLAFCLGLVLKANQEKEHFRSPVEKPIGQLSNGKKPTGRRGLCESRYGA